MNLDNLKRYYEKNELNNYDEGERAVKVYLDYLFLNNLTLTTCTVSDLELYMGRLVQKKENELNALLGLLRFFSVEGAETLYLYFLTLLGGMGVMESIKTSVSLFEDKEIADQVFDMGLPELGKSLENLSTYTGLVMKNLKQQCPKKYTKILAGNHHNLPVASQKLEVGYYQASSSFEEYLKDRHVRKIAELEKHLLSGQVWFEQKISQEVVDYVKADPEVLSGVVKDGKLTVTKIPYNTEEYLKAQSDQLKRYHYCHCSYAKAAILDGSIDLDPDWCYCSAGFAKFPFEVILNRKLNVKVLASVLKGDMKCRFEIDLEEAWEK